jgi:hypothetical protein
MKRIPFPPFFLLASSVQWGLNGGRVPKWPNSSDFSAGEKYLHSFKHSIAKVRQCCLGFV